MGIRAGVASHEVEYRPIGEFWQVSSPSVADEDCETALSDLRSNFEAFIDLDPSERERRLAALRLTQPSLAMELARLLASHESVPGEVFLDKPIASLAMLLGHSDAIESVGEVIGNYQLLERIGTGSFSVVWRARQIAPVRREVAMKILKPGLDVATIAKRFDDEQDALSRLEHPCISRLYDAGLHKSGRPWFVMELVRGSTIVEYVHDQKLSPAGIARLMAEVCRAVQFAHDRGIVHRDLKPANILIQADASVALPKVIDFGIARMITPDRMSSMTLAVVPTGTPAYMSPEQACLEEVDGRSDVFSLGVVLFELLADDSVPSVRDVERVTLELRDRQIDPCFAAVVLHALARNKDDRYQSPAHFASDLDCLSAGKRPSAAIPAAFKTIRHRAVVMACGAIALLAAVWFATRDSTQPAAPIRTPAEVVWPPAARATRIWQVRPENNGGWWSLEVDESARRVLAVPTTGDLLEIDLDSGRILRNFRPDSRRIIRCVRSGDRKSFGLITEDDAGGEQRLLILDPTLSETSRLSIRGAAHALCMVDAAGQRIAVSVREGDDSRIDFYDVSSGSKVASTPAWKSQFAPAYLVSAADGRTILTVSPAGELVQIDSTTGRILNSLASVSPGSAALTMLDRNRLAVTGEYVTTILDPIGPVRMKLQTPVPSTLATLSKDGLSVIVGSIDHKLTWFSLANGKPLKRVDLAGDATVIESAIPVDGDTATLIRGADGSMRLMRLP